MAGHTWAGLLGHDLLGQGKLRQGKLGPGQQRGMDKWGQIQLSLGQTGLSLLGPRQLVLGTLELDYWGLTRH